MKNTDGVLAHLSKMAARPLTEAMGAEPEFYWSAEIAALEEAHIFRKDWICPGLAAEIPRTGDYITFTIADQPVYCIRDKAGKVRTFSNICRHRMMQLLEGSGRATRVVCPYHAWTYDLEGRLAGATHMEHSAHFDKKSICLPEIRTEVWHGWIYITLNPDAPAVAEALNELDAIVAPYNMEHYVPVLKEDHVWQTNWKLLTENFMEGYHLPVAHKATVGAWFVLGETVFPEKSHEYFTYQTFEKTENASYGVAHTKNRSLKGRWRSTSILPTVFPNHMYVLAPDHLWYLSLRPRGVGEVDVRFGVAIAPEVNEDLQDTREREKWIEELTDFFAHVNKEDRGVVEGIYAGSRSSFASPGPLSWLEREIHDFQKYLASRLAPRATGGDS